MQKYKYYKVNYRNNKISKIKQNQKAKKKQKIFNNWKIKLKKQKKKNKSQSNKGISQWLISAKKK